MKTLTDHLLPHAEAMDEYFRRGAQRASRHERGLAMKLYQSYREKRGFTGPALRLLTWPSDNDKLGKGKVPSFGLTLQHTTTRVKRGLVVNACPHAGDCQKVCVLDNGNGSFEAVKEARRAKVDFLCEQPRAFAYLLGWELAAARSKYPAILLRPNTNSDVEWERILPSMLDGSAIDLTAYDYTKSERVLATDGWLAPRYRVAYSWSERSPSWGDVLQFLGRGGSVAVVTDRKKGSPVRQWAPQSFLDGRVFDADLSDLWMFEERAIGDLSAKGRARRLIGKSGFVLSIPQPRPATAGDDVVHAA
jgi:hypothetical protein